MLTKWWFTIEPARRGAFELLQKAEMERDGAANYSLNGVDVTKPEGKAVAEQRGIVAFPWIEIYYPIHSQAGRRFGRGRSLWTAPREF